MVRSIPVQFRYWINTRQRYLRHSARHIAAVRLSRDGTLAAQPANPRKVRPFRATSPATAKFTAETDWLAERAGFEPSVSHRGGASGELERGRLENRCPSYGGPRVRIPLPPPASRSRHEISWLRAQTHGPKRAGKGTIARVLAWLVGTGNAVAPTLAGLGMNFGLAPQIGKRVAIISDARLGGRADQHAIAERRLSITGEDAITIDRKYLSRGPDNYRPGSSSFQTKFRGLPMPAAHLLADPSFSC